MVFLECWSINYDRNISIGIDAFATPKFQTIGPGIKPQRERPIKRRSSCGRIRPQERVQMQGMPQPRLHIWRGVYRALEGNNNEKSVLHAAPPMNKKSLVLHLVSGSSRRPSACLRHLWQTFQTEGKPTGASGIVYHQLILIAKI